MPERPPPAESAAPADQAVARDNAAVADLLREMASLLEAQGEENTFRIAAYRHAADTVAGLRQSVRELFEREGLPGLDALPTIGAGIAAAIGEIVQTGRWARLDRLRGAAGSEAVFRTIPGVGAQLALRLHDELGVDTLEALEVAAYDGRLERLPHLGARRAAAIRAALTQMLDRARALRHRRTPPPPDHLPPLEAVLEVDRQYRAGATAGTLPLIAPHRFNPEGKAWLPVLHARRGDWSFTALFSNTARPRARPRARLGGGLRRGRAAPRAHLHGGDRGARAAGRTAYRARTRGRMPRVLREGVTGQPAWPAR